MGLHYLNRPVSTASRRFSVYPPNFQVFITRLRRALSRDPRLRIVNVRGTGYKLIAE